MDFFAENWGTVLVGAVVACAVVLVIVKLYRDKKHGKTSCGCGCENCPSSGVCHKK